MTTTIQLRLRRHLPPDPSTYRPDGRDSIALSRRDDGAQRAGRRCIQPPVFPDLLKGTPSGLILMQLADPEGFKKSEEAVSGASAHITELPFTNVLTHLQRTGVTVPTLHYFDREAGPVPGRFRRPDVGGSLPGCRSREARGLVSPGD